MYAARESIECRWGCRCWIAGILVAATGAAGATKSRSMGAAVSMATCAGGPLRELRPAGLGALSGVPSCSAAGVRAMAIERRLWRRHQGCANMSAIDMRCDGLLLRLIVKNSCASGSVAHGRRAMAVSAS